MLYNIPSKAAVAPEKLISIILRSVVIWGVPTSTSPPEDGSPSPGPCSSPWHATGLWSFSSHDEGLVLVSQLGHDQTSQLGWGSKTRGRSQSQLWTVGLLVSMFCQRNCSPHCCEIRRITTKSWAGKWDESETLLKELCYIESQCSVAHFVQQGQLYLLKLSRT